MPVLNDLGQVAAWQGYAARRGGAPAMLHLDTGMARLGLPPNEIAQLAAEPTLLAGFSLALIVSPSRLRRRAGASDESARSSRRFAPR